MKYLCILLVLAGSAAAQRGYATNGGYLMDCSKSLSLGCESYNELIAHNDPDILAELNGNSAYVCFRDRHDEFFVVYYREPSSLSYRKTEDEIFKAYGLVNLAVYNGGNAERNKHAPGMWLSFDGKMNGMFASSENATVQATIDAGEIGFSYKYTNLRGNKTSYFLQIRRSTRRFTETYTYLINQKTGAASRDEEQGYCESFLQKR